MPGIGNTHIHPAMVMPKRAFCGLPGTFYEPTEEQTIDALKECIANYPEDREWFVATGWTMPAFAPETLTREFLDQLIPDRPAFIEDETGGHTAWFNTRAMEAAGVSRDTEDTPESFFSRTEKVMSRQSSRRTRSQTTLLSSMRRAFRLKPMLSVMELCVRPSMVTKQRSRRMVTTVYAITWITAV